jgi:hypothetical protein
MFGKKKAKGKPALLLNNGKRWFLLEEESREFFEEGAPDILPEKFLEDCHKRKIKRAKILIPSDLNLLDIELIEELEPEEKHTAVAWELSSVAGCDPEKSRIAFADAGAFSFGGGRNLKVCAVFSKSVVKSFKEQLWDSEIKFEGLGSLQMALAAAHSKSDDNANEHLLFMREASSFAFIAGADGGVPSCRNLPIGFPGALPENRDWGERLRKRLGPIIGGDIHFVLNEHIENIDEALKRELRCNKLSFEFLDELLDKIFNAVVEEPGFFAVEQPKEKDPRTPGTVIAVTMIFLTASLLLLQGAWNACAKNSLKETINLKKELDSEREKYKSQLDSVKKNISRTIKTYRLLEEHRRIDDDFIFMLDSLARITPKYTRLNEIRQDDDGGIAINGVSYTQRDIAKFAKNLVELSSKRNLNVEPEDIQSKSGAIEKKFSFKIRKKQ